MRDPKVLIAVLVGLLSTGFGVWRIVRAFSGSSTTTSSFSIPVSPPDPACASPASPGYNGATCFDNPCNPTSVNYQAANPACQPIGAPAGPAGVPGTPGVPGQTAPP